jgi:chaperone modulatory protein CbpM
MSRCLTATIVEEDIHLSLAELSRACRTGEEQIRVWVVEGVLQPSGAAPHEWRFAGPSLRRAKRAISLSRELEINSPGVALALDLLDRIEELEARLRRLG